MKMSSNAFNCFLFYIHCIAAQNRPGNTIIIEETYNDVVDNVDDNERGGWLTVDKNGSKILNPFLFGNENKYHGPFQGNTSFNLSQYFYCSSQSMVSVTYSMTKCNTNERDHVIVYFNDLRQIDHTLNGTEFNPYFDGRLLNNVIGTGCNSFEHLTIHSLVLPSVGTNEEFQIKFEILLSSMDKILGIYDINIMCDEFTTFSPSKNPTISPSEEPSDNPSKGPSFSPSELSIHSTYTSTETESEAVIAESTKSGASAIEIISIVFGFIVVLLIIFLLLYFKLFVWKKQSKQSESKERYKFNQADIIPIDDSDEEDEDIIQIYDSDHL